MAGLCFDSSCIARKGSKVCSCNMDERDINLALERAHIQFLLSRGAAVICKTSSCMFAGNTQCIGEGSPGGAMMPFIALCPSLGVPDPGRLF